jgi:hypothetical protein
MTTGQDEASRNILISSHCQEIFWGKYKDDIKGNLGTELLNSFRTAERGQIDFSIPIFGADAFVLLTLLFREVVK